MKYPTLRSLKMRFNRRSFLKRGAVAAGATTLGASLFEKGLSAFEQEGPEEKSGRLTPGDAAQRDICLSKTSFFSEGKR